MRAFLLQIAIYTVLAYESSGRDRESGSTRLFFSTSRPDREKTLPFATRIVRLGIEEEFCCISKRLGFYGV
jgi:hypothetical protein